MSLPSQPSSSTQHVFVSPYEWSEVQQPNTAQYDSTNDGPYMDILVNAGATVDTFVQVNILTISMR